MSKNITINDIALKELLITKSGSELSVNLYYALLDSTGTELDFKRHTITDSQFTSGQKTTINSIISTVEAKLRTKENL